MKEYLNSITPIDTTISRARVDQLKREGIESYRRERTANRGGDKNGQEENKRQRQAQSTEKDVEETVEETSKTGDAAFAGRNSESTGSGIESRINEQISLGSALEEGKADNAMV